jgi:hypothetical protein
MIFTSGLAKAWRCYGGAVCKGASSCGSATATTLINRNGGFGSVLRRCGLPPVSLRVVNKD